MFWFKYTRSVYTLYDYNEQYSLVVFRCGCVSFPELLAKEKVILFDEGKTELIYFHNKRKPVKESITIGPTTIKPVEVVRWLEIYLDRKLDFKTYVEKQINVVTAIYFGLQRLSTTQKGLSFKALRQLYIACVTLVADFRI